MYKLRCSDMGVPSCNFVAEANTKEEVIKIAEDHFKASHPDDYKNSMERINQKEMDEMLLKKLREE